MSKRKDPAAAALGRKGGKSTAKKRTPEERSEAARKAVQARWDREKRTTQGQRNDLKEEKYTWDVKTL